MFSYSQIQLILRISTNITLLYVYLIAKLFMLKITVKLINVNEKSQKLMVN